MVLEKVNECDIVVMLRFWRNVFLYGFFVVMGVQFPLGEVGRSVPVAQV